MTPLAIASDHGGFALKEALKQALMQWGIAFEDLGPFDPSSCDYPDYAHLMARVIGQGRFPRGVLICGTGVGMSMAANRHPHIRAAVVSDTYSARMAREHNDANVLCMGERVVGQGLACDILRVFLDTPSDSSDRHARRIAKLSPGEPVE
ncbi:MAG TPA: ribose 5-phosphate isomerase B [Polyangiaceae bacterium]|jgi:ribose 5-phosphate isomerase B|nr:MAG: putative sugar phosphate isomerase YwlF [Deltaproteobacteria bacterium ADurb.Bin207]HNS97547.1 ribose 5-phosphate isomerase B [Polyangiaceae bacterium]HNZ23265.1 ribose 5-phosphate isomerase B [Polyangiaceae bacterium]HOD23301.1 ribose 5-phosphate isomerase B [Polyangiaceae bacterium]HOE50608.1 ribose 5-phosphate isomerase B [Polyangiaceae bacterium]